MEKMMIDDKSGETIQVSPTPSATAIPPPKRKSLAFQLAFVGLSIVAFTSSMDATIFAIALPIVAQDLGASTLESFWAGIAFLLTAVAFLPVHVSLSDVFGRKPVLYFCIVLFAVGALVFGLAKTSATLVAGRAIQGVGGGGLEALAEVILTDITTLKERPMYIGILNFMFAGGAILGPIVGALFAEFVTWRWIAWINLPLIGISMALLPFFLKLNVDDKTARSKIMTVDLVGMILFIGGITGLILVTVWGGQLYAWSEWQTVLPLVLGIVSLMLFIWWELHHKSPMIPVRRMKNRTIIMSLFGAMLHGIVVWGETFYLPVYFEGALQQAPLKAAISAFPTMFTVTPIAIIAAIMIEVLRSYCWSIWSGWLLCILGFGLMTLLDSRSSLALYSGVQIPAGIGMGFLFPALNLSVQAAAEIEDVGTITGLLVFSRSLGSAFGVAIGASIFSNQFASRIVTVDIPSNLGLIDASKAVDYIPIIRTLDLAKETLEAILDVYGGSVKYIWIVLAVLSAVGFLSSLLIKELSIEKEDHGRQTFVE